MQPNVGMVQSKSRHTGAPGSELELTILVISVVSPVESPSAYRMTKYRHEHINAQHKSDQPEECQYIAMTSLFLSRSYASIELTPPFPTSPIMPKKYKTPEERHAARLVSKRRHYTRYTLIYNSPMADLYCNLGIVLKNR